MQFGQHQLQEEWGGCSVQDELEAGTSLPRSHGEESKDGDRAQTVLAGYMGRWRLIEVHPRCLLSC